MKNKGKLLLSLFLITWVLFAFVSLVNNGQNYIGKSFFKSENFKMTLETYKEQLGRYVLEPFDAEEAKKNITISQNEIENHRNYYGTLSEQIENIRAQYRERIWQLEGESVTEEQTVTVVDANEASTETNSEGKASTNSTAELLDILKKERDGKIADITKNFQNDEYVAEKIRKQKKELIDLYAEQEDRNKKDFLNQYSYFAYSFKNLDTGEKIKSEDEIYLSDVYIEKFGNQNPYLKVDSSVNIFPQEFTSEFREHFLMDSFFVAGKLSQFEGSISIPKSMMNASGFKNDYTNFTISKIIYYVIWATGILALIGLLTFAKPSLGIFANSNRAKAIFSRWPIDVRTITVLILFGIGFTMMESFVNNTIHHIMYNFEWDTILIDLFNILVPVLFMFAATSASIVGGVWVWEAVNNGEKIKREVKRAFLYRLADGLQDLFLNRTIGTQSVAILVIAFLAGIGFVGAVIEGHVLVIVYIVLLFCIAIPSFIIFLRRMGYLNRIMKQTKDMAEGRLTTEIIVKGKSPLSKHAANLNELREGVRKSVSEQAKSERLKTELITNVSHDLRTPLTSIITYTDLLKNPDTTEEERKQYIDVLDKKSARLKTLIEDLFEVSKMASGNMELTKRRVDLTQLLQQAVGEHKEAFEKVNLELRVSLLEKPLFAYVDGQKWWRVIDNLVVNALKYSLDGTRVYVTLKQSGNEAELTVKNISSYEMSENVEELTERFKRADASRHTDGSGLGLAIAQSIVDMHNGRLKVDVDGDLFKVTVLVPMDI